MKKNIKDIDKSYIYKLYTNREYHAFHETADSEQIFYSAVKCGDYPLVEKLLKEHSLDKKQKLGKLSNSPIQNLKYHFAISTALVTRHCIEGGMAREAA